MAWASGRVTTQQIMRNWDGSISATWLEQLEQRPSYGWPITGFVACGFEHSVANMYFLPIGVALAAGTSMPLSAVDAFSNRALVTIGNIFGGTVLVALVYWMVYLRRLNQITGTLSS